MALEGCNLHTLLQVMPTECQHLCREESRAAITPGPGLAFGGRVGSANCRGGEQAGAGGGSGERACYQGGRQMRSHSLESLCG